MVPVSVRSGYWGIGLAPMFLNANGEGCSLWADRVHTSGCGKHVRDGKKGQAI